MRKIYNDSTERFKVYYEKNKEVIVVRSKEWDEKNREKRNAISKAWRERNKEKMAAIKKAYVLSNKEKITAYKKENKNRIAEVNREWRKNNPEKRSMTYKKYRKNNPDKVLESTSIRRARLKKGVIVKFTASQLRQRLSVFGGKCWICGGVADQVDHVIPLAKGGAHALSNLRPSCGKCNRVKGASIIHKPKMAKVI